MFSELISGSSGPGSSPAQRHCIQGGVEILLVASCYRTGIRSDKLRPDGPWLMCILIYLLVFLLDRGTERPIIYHPGRPVVILLNNF